MLNALPLIAAIHHGSRSHRGLRQAACAGLTALMMAWGGSTYALDAASQKELEAVGMAATVAELCAAPIKEWEHLARFQELAAVGFAKVMEKSDRSVKTAFATGHKRAMRFKAELSAENCNGLMPRIKHTNGLFADTNEMLKKMIAQPELAAAERVVALRLKKAQETAGALAKKGRLPSGAALPKPGTAKTAPPFTPPKPLDLP